MKGDTFYIYDRNGNLVHTQTGDLGSDYGYDALDRLIRINSDNLVIHYTYDLFNRRISIKVEEGFYSTWSDYYYGIKSWNTIENDRYIYQGTKEIGLFLNFLKENIQPCGYLIGINLKDPM